MTNNSKIIELCKKLKELADKGVGGEKVNAAQMLSNLMNKHGISEEELKENLVTNHIFSVGVDKNIRILFVQVAKTVFDERPTFHRNTRTRAAMMIRCTAIQAIEVQAKWNYYEARFDAEANIFLRAFIRSNELYPSYMENRDPSEMTEEELLEAQKMIKLAEQLEKGQYNKQLN